MSHRLVNITWDIAVSVSAVKQIYIKLDSERRFKLTWEMKNIIYPPEVCFSLHGFITQYSKESEMNKLGRDACKDVSND